MFEVLSRQPRFGGNRLQADRPRMIINLEYVKVKCSMRSGNFYLDSLEYCSLASKMMDECLDSKIMDKCLEGRYQVSKRPFYNQETLYPQKQKADQTRKRAIIFALLLIARGVSTQIKRTEK